MPLTTHDSFPEVMDEFLAHWALVDGVLGPGNELTVRVAQGAAAVGRGDLAALAVALREKLGALDRKELEGRVAARELALRRTAAREGLRVFSDTVRAWWTGWPEAEVVRPLPKEDWAPERLMAAVRWGLMLWERIDTAVAGVPAGVVVPLVAGPAPGLDRGGLEGRLEALVAARGAVEALEFAAAVLRAERDALEAEVRAVLVAYARAVPVRLGPDAVAVQSVPRVSPLPGRTPAPVALAGAWDDAAQGARLEWGASTEGEALDFYQVRWCAGPDYNKKEERVALRLPADGERVAVVRAGLEVPGAVASYKVYVVVKSGNERGSQAVAVERPRGE